jgi:hypothetical protein
MEALRRVAQHPKLRHCAFILRLLMMIRGQTLRI